MTSDNNQESVQESNKKTQSPSLLLQEDTVIFTTKWQHNGFFGGDLGKEIKAQKGVPLDYGL